MSLSWCSLGMLRYMNQKMDNLWLIFDRRTNASRVIALPLIVVPTVEPTVPTVAHYAHS